MYMNDIIVTCPNCQESIIIEKLNCCIFRHGVNIKTGQQINAHSSRDSCEQNIKDKLIYGCGKPFKITVDRDRFVVEKCDYI